MTTKRIVLFRPVGRLQWSQETAGKMGGKLNSSGSVEFGPGSEVQVEAFQQLAEEKGWDYVKASIPKIGKREILQHSYVYLSPRILELGLKQSLGDFYDLSTACEWCRSGWRQVRKLRFDPAWVRGGADLVSPSTGLGGPAVNLVSKNLAQKIKEQGFTGVKLVPCVSPLEPESEATEFATFSERLEAEAQFFQLQVETELPPPSIGSAHSTGRCGGTCGSEFFVAESMGQFTADDFSEELDFYYFRKYRDSNGRIYRMPGERIVTSVRFFRLFQESGFRGWSTYLTSPRIEIGLVEIDC